MTEIHRFKEKEKSYIMQYNDLFYMASMIHKIDKVTYNSGYTNGIVDCLCTQADTGYIIYFNGCQSLKKINISLDRTIQVCLLSGDYVQIIRLDEEEIKIPYFITPNLSEKELNELLYECYCAVYYAYMGSIKED